MKRLNKVLATLFLAALAPVAFAQHGSHGGTSSGGGFGDTGNESSMRDLKRALLLQATDDQRATFAKCLEATESARTIVDRMARPGTRSSYDAGIFPGQKEQLQAALAEMGAAHQNFQHSLGQAQEKELGKYLNKLNRFEADIGSRMAQLDRELSTNKPDPRRLHGYTQKIKEVTEKWRSEHRKIAKEMGIDG